MILQIVDFGMKIQQKKMKNQQFSKIFENFALKPPKMSISVEKGVTKP